MKSSVDICSNRNTDDETCLNALTPAVETCHAAPIRAESVDISNLRIGGIRGKREAITAKNVVDALLDYPLFRLTALRIADRSHGLERFSEIEHGRLRWWVNASHTSDW